MSSCVLRIRPIPTSNFRLRRLLLRRRNGISSFGRFFPRSFVACPRASCPSCTRCRRIPPMTRGISPNTRGSPTKPNSGSFSARRVLSFCGCFTSWVSSLKSCRPDLHRSRRRRRRGNGFAAAARRGRFGIRPRRFARLSFPPLVRRQLPGLRRDARFLRFGERRFRGSAALQFLVAADGRRAFRRIRELGGGAPFPGKKFSALEKISRAASRRLRGFYRRLRRREKYLVFLTGVFSIIGKTGRPEAGALPRRSSEPNSKNDFRKF